MNSLKLRRLLLLLAPLLTGCFHHASEPSATRPLERPSFTIYRDNAHGFQFNLPTGWTASPTQFEALHYNVVFLTISNKGAPLKIQTQAVGPNEFEYNDKVIYRQMQPGQVYIAVGDWEGPGILPPRPDSVGENLHSLLSTNPLTASSDAPLEELELNFSKHGRSWNIRVYLSQPITEEDRRKAMSILQSFRFIDHAAAHPADSEPRTAATSSANRLPASYTVCYCNSQYGLKFFLPADWHGYSVLIQQWQADSEDDPSVKNGHGPIIVLRSPKWKPSHPYQDIPILVFTRRQWDVEQGPHEFGIFAGGIEYEISHNAKYIFAIWSRFNWDDSIPGTEEAHRIVDANLDAGKPHLPESQD